MKLRISPNPSHQPSVGVMEEFSGGAGAQWRTAVWQAAFAASTFNKVSLNDYEFLVRVGGHIDGPSAGLLMSASFAALQRGQAIRPRTTMTGTINPDGSAGPVGGIVQKMRGAAAQGFKRFGFPSGARTQIDVTTGEQVDLLALAQELNIEAKELHTLGEAYEFLSGEAVVEGALLAESDMEFTIEESKMFRIAIERAEADGLRAMQDVEALLGQLEATDAKFVKTESTTIERKWSRAKADVSSGRLVSGYFGLASTAQYAHETASLARVLLPWRKGDYDSVAATLALNAGTVRSLELLSQDIDTQYAPGSVLNDAYAFDILEDVASALMRAVELDSKRADLIAAVRALKTNSSAKDRDSVFRQVRSFAIARGTIESNVENARRFAAAYASVRPVASRATAFDAASGARALYGSGSASLAYFDALVTAPEGAAAGLTLDVARSRLIKFDATYAESLERQRFLSLDIGSPRVRFVFAYLLHFSAAWLSNKYYSLDASTRDGVTTVSSPRALTLQFDVARSAALRSCNEAAQAGWIPPMARIRYGSAVENREGDDAAKLNALSNFWLAKFWCDYVSGRVR
ncbi:MAG: hypothetical protein QM817_03205 [Archangium sp.]